ncbi:DEAD/DEAH box helicase [Campylobacter sp. LR185c]|uniref:EcoAI/FtnUII family type I restriction enzme subunit R n=1 Tax=Campylobacter sp. LR185c TaxID=2014525 RepID=UPI001237D7A3|nr:DEAD/DEAH box helicase family protein [Campylobacter sp. LR185c]KAA6226647.1 DEAD/DEAH box helicase [Campylobacter sp. LR185c]KAA8603226.1 restriction endonuclease subunit R [Campylobacter sp. LR185c]
MDENEVRQKIITPSLLRAGWRDDDINEERTMRKHVEFTKGRMVFLKDEVKRVENKRYDYCLRKHGVNLAIIEAKRYDKRAEDGIQQAIEYAFKLDIKFVYASNGKKFIEHDCFTGKEREFNIDEFPSPDELYNRYIENKNIPKERLKLLQTPGYYEINNDRKTREERYYQENAVNLSIEAIARGQNRLLLVMATGTGKTYVSFQIVYRLFKAGIVKRVLYLVDRNTLIDQTMQGDFNKVFKDKMTKIKNKKMKSNYNIYFALYQQFFSNDDNKIVEHYKQFKEDFFDLIIIDECHRGSANETSIWRGIVEYFKPAIQLGMTATPKYKEKKEDNIDYFGEPIYVYSLKKGIEDGFLAPYKVVSYNSNIDDGIVVNDKEYKLKDFDKKIEIKDYTRLVAQTISNFLKYTLKDRYAKTIVFCEDQYHANTMRRELINANSDEVSRAQAQEKHYVLRITSVDKTGKENLDDFVSTDSVYPVIVTTSRLLSTGVDTKMVKVIVIAKNINSVTEFKQIIGRGTRLLEEKGKKYFTILDFKNSVENFKQEGFDPTDYLTIQGKLGGSISGGKGGYPPIIIDPPTPPLPPTEKIRINGIDCYIIREKHQLLDSNGKLITDDFIGYSRENLIKKYQSLEDFLRDWNANKNKTEFFKILEENLIFIEYIKGCKEYKEYDEFDIILSLAYGQKPITRKTRAKKLNDFINTFQLNAKRVLEILLEKYAQHGIVEIENPAVFQNEPFNGNFDEIFSPFGGIENYKEAINTFKEKLYQ